MRAILIFTTAANAVLPLVLMILLGCGLRRSNFVSESFVNTGNKLVFRLFLPAMLFLNVYDLEGIHAIDWHLVAYCCTMVVALFGLGFLAALAFSRNNAQRGVILQSAFRSNMSIIGVPLAAALGSDEAMGIATMLAGFTVALYNILAVLSFTIFSENKSSGFDRMKKSLRSLIGNPLILSIGAGLLCLLVRQLQQDFLGRIVFSFSRDIPFLYTVVKNLKAVTTSFSLIVLGGQFVFEAVKRYRGQIILGTVLRVVMAPAIGIGAAIALKHWGVLTFGPEAYPALIALFGSPAAVSGPIMANQMGGDSQLATQIVMWSSIASIFTIFTTACILMSTGLMPV